MSAILMQSPQKVRERVGSGSVSCLMIWVQVPSVGLALMWRVQVQGTGTAMSRWPHMYWYAVMHIWVLACGRVAWGGVVGDVGWLSGWVFFGGVGFV